MKRIISSGNLLSSGGVEAIRTYNLPNDRILHIVKGSVLDYASRKGAIVNSANEECLGGGGVDFAITNAGGSKLLEDRKALPCTKGRIRCPMGEARLTGPNRYGKIGTPYVIHAVGPNYNDFMNHKEGEEEENTGSNSGIDLANAYLRNAYQSALHCTKQGTSNKPIKKIAFSLISAGRFKGNQTLDHVLGIGIQAIHDWCNEKKDASNKLDIIILYAFNENETKTLLQLCDTIIGAGTSTNFG